MRTSRPPHHRPATTAARPRRRRALAIGALLLPMLFAFGAAPGAASASEPAPGATGEPTASNEPAAPVAADPTETAAPPASAAPVTPPVTPPATDAVESSAPDVPGDPTPSVEPPAGDPEVTPAPDAPSGPPVAEPPAVAPAPPPATTDPPRPAAPGPATGTPVSRPAGAAATGSRLGTAGTFAILAGSTITNTGRSVVTGNVGLHPGSAVTGFGACTGVANCVDLTGSQHVANGVAKQAKADLSTAYDTLVGLEDTCTPIAVELAGQTLTPGVYCSPTFGLTGTLTLSGVGEFVFLTGAGGSSLTTAPGSAVLLVDGADQCGVYWQVASSAVLGTRTAFAGNILAHASVSFGAGATLDGSALAQTAAVTLIGNTITDSACGADEVPPGEGETPPEDGETPPDGGDPTPDDGDTTPDGGEAAPGDDEGTPSDTDGGGTVLPGVGMAGSGSGGTRDADGSGSGAGDHQSLPATGSPVELHLLLAALMLGAGVVMTLVGARFGRARR